MGRKLQRNFPDTSRETRELGQGFEVVRLRGKAILCKMHTYYRALVLYSSEHLEAFG